MDRTIYATAETFRSFDLQTFEHDVLIGLANSIADALGENSELSTNAAPVVLGGFAATPTSPASMTINLASGRIYAPAEADATADNAIPVDSTIILQQGQLAPSTVTLNTAGIGAGQSRWTLIQAQFSQVDVVRVADPNGGNVPFYNAANPSSPTFNSVNTVRQGIVVVQAVNGAAATTGSEVPPTPTSGWVPMYLIDLSFGQTTITLGEILVAGPSVGTGVPSNYPGAPFLAGLLNSHHSGLPGAAPKINLATETTGQLPAGLARTRLNGNTSFYVSTTGSDSTGTGLSSGSPWLTMQHAYNTIQNNYDLNGYQATIQLADGTYSQAFNPSGSVVGQTSVSGLVLNGNSITPTNVVINASSGAACVEADFDATLVVQNLQVQGVNGLSSLHGAKIFASAVTFGLITGIGLNALEDGNIEIAGNCKISGSMAVFASATTGGQILLSTPTTSVTITLTGTPAFSGAFAETSDFGLISAPHNTFTGSATGVRYTVGAGGGINTGGGGASYFPGSSAGSVMSPGYYV